LESSLAQIVGLVFDLDGTLVESYAAHIKSWSSAVASFGIKALEGDIRPHLGRSSEDIARALLGRKDDRDVETAFRLKDEIYLRILPSELKPVRGALETLAGLKARGYRISIASSNPTRVITRSLEAVRLNHLADSIASQDEVKRGKPEPDLFLLASRKLGLGPGKCLAVGDTAYDVLAGKAAGMKTVAFSGGVQAASDLRRVLPDYLIRDLCELLVLLPESGPIV